jgi:meso-butanediol dehydrogenase/(S,S)-butanediol dehydrogenase/diacetyl reductase
VSNGRFKGLIAVITGGGSGIGRAISLQMAREGASLAILDINKEALIKTANDIEELGANVLTLQTNIGDTDSFARDIDKVVHHYGRLDILVNNAASTGAVEPIDTMSLSAWNNCLSVTLTSTFIGTKTALPHMLRQGSGAIINIASVSGLSADVGLSAYNAAKAGVINFTKSTALEYTARGIRANSVCPGAIETPPIIALFNQPDSIVCAERKQQMIQSHAANRMGKSEEVAEVVCFLASKSASFVSGAAYTVDGGLLASTGMPTLPVGVYGRN